MFNNHYCQEVQVLSITGRPLAVLITAALMAGCAYPMPGTISDSKVFVHEASTTRSESAVQSCASGRITARGLSSSHNAGSETQITAYGRGPVANYLSFKTESVGNETVLAVFARSRVFPESGRGEANSNFVDVAATAEARAEARELAQVCAGEG